MGGTWKTIPNNANDFSQTEAGLIVDQNAAFIGALQDGFVSCKCCGKGIVEVECHLSISHEVPSALNLTYLEKPDRCDYIEKELSLL